MIRAYFGMAGGLVMMGQLSASTSGEQLLDQALAGDPSLGPIIDQAQKLATLGLTPTDAAVIVAIAGVAWKFLDTQQKGGTFDTINLWLRRKLKVDDHPPHNPPNPPLA